MSLQIDPPSLETAKRELLAGLMAASRSHTVFFPLPLIRIPGFSSLDLAPHLKVTTLDEKQIKSANVVRLSSQSEIAVFDENTVCLSFDLKGFAFPSNLSTFYGLAVRKAKQILGAGIVAGFLESNPGIAAYHSVLQFQSRAFCVMQPNGSDKVFAVPLGTNESRFVGQLTPSAAADRVLNAGQRPIEIRTTKAHYERVFPEEQGLSREVLSEIERVRTGLEWFFNGLSNDNQTFSYVQLAIAFEALLGEGGNNIVDRLSDRCAYLVATGLSPKKDHKEAICRCLQAAINDCPSGQKQTLGRGTQPLLSSYLLAETSTSERNSPTTTTRCCSQVVPVRSCAKAMPLLRRTRALSTPFTCRAVECLTSQVEPIGRIRI
jgi:hypothetical protein